MNQKSEILQERDSFKVNWSEAERQRRLIMAQAKQQWLAQLLDRPSPCIAAARSVAKPRLVNRAG